MFRTFGWPELLLILGIVVLLFGATRLPQLGKAIGRTIRNFRQGMSGDEEKSEQEEDQEPGK